MHANIRTIWGGGIDHVYIYILHAKHLGTAQYLLGGACPTSSSPSYLHLKKQLCRQLWIMWRHDWGLSSQVRTERPSTCWQLACWRGNLYPKLSAKAAEVKNLIKPISHFIQQYVSQHRELGCSESVGVATQHRWAHWQGWGLHIGTGWIYQIAKIAGGVQPSPEHCH